VQGGIIDKDMPLPVASVAIVSPGDGKPTRVGYRYDDQGRKIRICKRTGTDL
jgi:large subunit ribosomal protein L24